MLQPPKCHLDKCNNSGMLLIKGEFICGECYMKYFTQRTKTILGGIK